MGEIQKIMQQFKQGEGEWKHFIKSIKISNLHGWTGQEVVFRFPVVAIVGENGIGKSTFLKAAVCAYKNTQGKTFYPSNMFISTKWDASALAGAEIVYKVLMGTQEKVLRWRKTNDWGFSPKGKKPERNVYFLDISRTLPLDATAGYAKIAKTATAEVGDSTVLTDESVKNLSYVLGQQYDNARFVGTNANRNREVGLLTKAYGEISQFHQGAGEDSILDIFKLLQDIPHQSLLIIDEVENSLHPQAQRRFIQYLLKLSRQKKLQIILSTHSPFVLEELPSVGRIMLMQLSDKKDVIDGVSTNFALSTIDDIAHPDFFIYVEDEEAASLFWEIVKLQQETYDEICKKITVKAVGSYTVVDTLNKLSRKDKLPNKGLGIVDSDKREECPDCLCFPGTQAPERQILLDLKKINWANLDNRFSVGAGTLFKYLDDATLLDDHHKSMTFIGDKIKMSKDNVWSILISEWCKQCLSKEDADNFIREIIENIDNAN